MSAEPPAPDHPEDVMFPSSPWIASQIVRHVYLERSRDIGARRLAREVRSASPVRRPVNGPRTDRPVRSRRHWFRTARTTVA
jgi:hypothetical protein